MAQIVKTSTKPAPEILPFHLEVYRIAAAGQRATQTMAQRMQTLVTSRYGTTCPTFAQHRADLKALDQIAKDKGLTDGQWMRRPYNAAIITLFDALPVSMAADAIVKREQRAARDKIVKAAIAKAKAEGSKDAPAPVGAPVGETQERTPSPAEQMEQTIASMGVWETLYACLRILDTSEATKAQVIHMRKMADKARDAQVAADKAAREAKLSTATTPIVS